MKTMQRWIEHPRMAADRPKVLYEYYVTGSGAFPFDMLRYDAAWPASSEDAVALDTIFPERRKTKSIKLRSWDAPTVDRWASFGWSVGNRKLVEEEGFIDGLLP